MGRRPTPNPRRGILRATITVVVLTVILILAILAVSSLSAPSAKAPTNPLTPGPITPITAPTATPGRTTRTTATPHAVPSPTAKKKTLGSLVQARPRVLALERAASRSLLDRAARRNLGGIAVRSHQELAWFSPYGNAGPTASLRVRSLPAGRAQTVGAADPLVKPVWSADGRFLLYVTSAQSRAFPGARWNLMQYDLRRSLATRLATLPGFGMIPLGWWRTRPLFLMATGTDTSLYSIRDGRARFVDVLAPQVITSAGLSPDTSEVAFVAPTNCYNCTLELFSLRTFTAWNGPSGITNESQLAWSQDGRSVITVLHGRVAVVPASPGAAVRLGGQLALPTLWQHSLTVSIRATGVRLLDTVDGFAVFSAFRAGAV